MRALALACLLASGCLVDPIADDAVFHCDPAHSDSSGTRSLDCGDGRTCYSAAASLGFAFCVPQCDANQACPTINGHTYRCTGAGGCLQDCSTSKNDCPAPLRCVSWHADEGFCLPVAATCQTDDNCASTVLNSCFGQSLFGSDPMTGQGPQSFCIQSGCNASQSACQPGSTCVKSLLPASINSPDICTPDCDHNLECPPDTVCVSTALPATTARFCMPGFYGFRCDRDTNCLTPKSECAPNLLESGSLAMNVCAVSCASDGDCAAFDQGTQSPSAYTRSACRGSHCMSLFGLLSALTCIRPDSPCGGSSGAVCRSVEIPDGGIQGPPPPAGGTCGTLGTTTSPPPYCELGCATRADCAPLESALHVPLTCLDPKRATWTPFGFLGAQSSPLCVPRIPCLPCADAGDCLAGLDCLPGPTGNVCTRKCTSDADCSSSSGFALGPGFRCEPNTGVCLPRMPVGRPPLSPDGSDCIFPKVMASGFCASPSGSPCASDLECQSGVCQVMGSGTSCRQLCK